MYIVTRAAVPWRQAVKMCGKNFKCILFPVNSDLKEKVQEKMTDRNAKMSDIMW